jgi:hypothetical protein
MAGEQPHRSSEHPATDVQGVLIVAREASDQLEIMTTEVRKDVLAAFRDLRIDPYGASDSQHRPYRAVYAVYDVAEYTSGLQGLMVLEDELFKMWYQILSDVRGIYVKVLKFPWWEGRPSSQAVMTRPPTTQSRNEGDYDFKFIANAIKQAGRIPGTIKSTRFIRLGRSKSAPQR